jgi:hypothetical protein
MKKEVEIDFVSLQLSIANEDLSKPAIRGRKFYHERRQVVFGSTPTEEADVEQLNILQSWLTEGSLEGLVVTPFRATSLNSALTRVSAKTFQLLTSTNSSRKR